MILLEQLIHISSISLQNRKKCIPLKYHLCQCVKHKQLHCKLMILIFLSFSKSMSAPYVAVQLIQSNRNHSWHQNCVLLMSFISLRCCCRCRRKKNYGPYSQIDWDAVDLQVWWVVVQYIAELATNLRPSFHNHGEMIFVYLLCLGTHLAYSVLILS